MNPLLLAAAAAGALWLYSKYKGHGATASTWTTQPFMSALSAADQQTAITKLYGWIAANPNACSAVDTSPLTSASALSNEQNFALAVDCLQTAVPAATASTSLAGVFDAPMQSWLLANVH